MSMVVGEKVIINAGPQKERTGFVHLITGSVLYVVMSDDDEMLRPYYENELLPFVEEEKPAAPKTNKQATKAVVRNLEKGFEADTTNVESFTSQARTWLQSNSDLKDATMDKADWQEIYNHFS